MHNAACWEAWGFMLLHKAPHEHVPQASSRDCWFGIICSYSLKKFSTHTPQQSGYCFSCN